MEEKERYEIVYFDNDTSWKIIDNKTKQEVGGIDDMIKLLNQQDKRIKELEEELENYKLCRCVDCSSEYEYGLETYIDELEKENQQLKQQLHDLPKKIVEEIRDVAGDYWEECGNVPDLNTLTMEDFDEILDTILEKFGGEDESNND